MKLSAAGITFIKSWERCRLIAYLDTGRVWTIGWGHTGPGIKMGTEWTQAKADSTFIVDAATAANSVDDLVQAPLTQSQYDAVVSLVYNIGRFAFSQSTILRLVNTEDYVGASAQFNRWIYDNGKVITGLVHRRAAEEALFSQDIKFILPESLPWKFLTPPLTPSQPTSPRTFTLSSLLPFLARLWASIRSGFFTWR